MKLVQNPKTGFFTDAVDSTGKPVGELTNVHPTSACATAPGCGIHNRPTDHALKDAPMNWRSDRGILERICEHGIGHPDSDSAAYLQSVGKDYENIHGCDGCCAPAVTTKEVQVRDLEGNETLISDEGGVIFVFNAEESSVIPGCFALETDFGMLYVDAERYVTVRL